MRESTQKSIDNITDVIAGADGGINYMTFLMLMREIDKKAEAGDAAAVRVVAVVTQFDNLLKLSQTVCEDGYKEHLATSEYNKQTTEKKKKRKK